MIGLTRFNPLSAFFSYIGLGTPPHHHFAHKDDAEFGSAEHLLSHSHSLYHGMEMQQAYGPGARSRINSVGLFVAVAVPVAFFVCLNQLMSSQYYYQHPESALLLVVGAVTSVLAMAPFALQSKRNLMSTTTNTFKDGNRGTWWSFIFFSSAVALALGLISGHANYRMHTRRYFDFMSLRKDVDLDPAVARGQQEMDVGQINFKKGTTIDASLTGVYHKTRSWCVAPLSPFNSSTQLAFYDFWAVGIDCCNPQGNNNQQGNFACGPTFNKEGSPSGIRVLDDPETVGYELAVQQASAQYGIQTRHPIFLHMTNHPWEQIKAYWDAGLLWSQVTAGIFFVVQCYMVYSEAVNLGTGEPSGHLDMESKSWDKRFGH